MSTQLHFQPIQGRTVEIIRAILNTEEVASADSVHDIHLVAEELVVNIVEYAYSDSSKGYLDVEVGQDAGHVTLCFRDGGYPFNPLEKDPPDTSLPIAQRKMGGLGIYLVMSKTDSAIYQYTNGENVFTVSIPTNKS